MSVTRELPYVAVIALIGAIGVGVGGGSGAEEPPPLTPQQREERALHARQTPDGKLSVFDLAVGDCLKTVPHDLPEALDAVTCDKPHDSEVFGVFQLKDQPEWPGTGVVEAAAGRRCFARLERDRPDTEVVSSPLIPSKQSWINDNDRAVICIATYPRRLRGRRYL